MNDAQLQVIDNYIALINSRIDDQSRLEQQAQIRANSLRYFKDELENLRVRLCDKDHRP